jgi:ligand-binding sensor domain-containing protein
MKQLKFIPIKTTSFASNMLLCICIFLVASCDKEVSKSPVEPEPSQGIIKINSIPNGSTIYLNGRITGRVTPDSLTYLESGSYQISLRRKYYKDTSVVINLGRDERQEVVIDYLSNPSMYGNIILRTNPTGANILLDDSLLTNKITPDTLRQLLPGEYNFIFRLENHRDFSVIGFAESGKTNIYSATLRDTSVWVDFQTHNSEIQSNLLTCIDIDFTGKKCVGTNDVGIILFDEKNFLSINTNNSGLPSNKIAAIKVSPSNEIWVGTAVGVARYVNSSWLVYNTSNSGLENNNITSINFDSQGNIWVGTRNGIAKFTNSSWQHFKYNSVFVQFLWVNDFTVDNNDHLWIGTSNYGIVYFTGSEFIEYHSEDFGFPTNKISSVSKDLTGNIWFGHNSDTLSNGGLSYFDGNIFTSIIFGSSLIKINDIKSDLNNNKWVSSTDGLFKINDQNNVEEFFNQSNSLISSNSVMATVVDKNGILWIATFGGGLNKYKESF